MAKTQSLHKESIGLKIVIYVVCIILAIASVLPFIIMFSNSMRSTFEIQQSSISFFTKDPIGNLAKNWKVFNGKSFDPATGFINSLIVSTGTTVLAVYFSCLTAYALYAYEWKMRDAFFGLIVGIMMIPGTVTAIGFYQAAYKVGMTNKLMMLILPAIASPNMVFFMRQYLQASLSMEIVDSARIDGAGEFMTFNRIVFPLMKPAIATQCIFTFVGSWNNLFVPQILLTKKEKFTLPIEVSLLNSDIYQTEYGSIYLGLSLTVIPLIIIYALLSRYIVEGVALGGVKS